MPAAMMTAPMIRNAHCVGPKPGDGAPGGKLSAWRICSPNMAISMRITPPTPKMIRHADGDIASFLSTFSARRATGYDFGDKRLLPLRRIISRGRPGNPLRLPTTVHQLALKGESSLIRLPILPARAKPRAATQPAIPPPRMTISALAATHALI